MYCMSRIVYTTQTLARRKDMPCLRPYPFLFLNPPPPSSGQLYRKSSCFRWTHFVEGLQVSDRRGYGQVVWELVLQVSDEHPKLGTPVPYVIQPGVQNTNKCSDDMVNKHTHTDTQKGHTAGQDVT
jgi:hypothetical protein